MKTLVRPERAGFTLVELLIVLTITALLASAIGAAFTAELTTQRLGEARRAELDRTDATEREITRLLQGAKVVAPPSDPAAAPASPTPGAAPDTSGPPVPPEQTTYFLASSANGASDLGCDRVTFTTTARAVPLASLDSTDDFETQQSARGPVGGLAEVSLGTDPVGDAGGRAGLFERLQRPADADPTQGGFESVLDPEIDRIGFQFWDGLEWVNDWPQADPPRLPGAVRVRYTLKARPGETRAFVVAIPASDVDEEHPVSQDATGAGAGGGL